MIRDSVELQMEVGKIVARHLRELNSGLLVVESGKMANLVKDLALFVADVELETIRAIMAKIADLWLNLGVEIQDAEDEIVIVLRRA